MINAFEIYVGDDPGKFGGPAAKGVFKGMPNEQEVRFEAVEGRYVCLKALSTHNEKPHTSVAELGFLGK